MENLGGPRREDIGGEFRWAKKEIVLKLQEGVEVGISGVPRRRLYKNYRDGHRWGFQVDQEGDIKSLREGTGGDFRWAKKDIV